MHTLLRVHFVDIGITDKHGIAYLESLLAPIEIILIPLKKMLVSKLKLHANALNNFIVIIMSIVVLTMHT